ncbi:MAG TPA: DUF1697 domain-containing protein [Longimicrobiaceae bacterium]|nr:DUF1697 domain-containing protein [Longimicrobiaceae bacterium]
MTPLAAAAVQRCVAFLRAINVGGHTVRMDRLRDLFRELGLAEVESFIASGNLVFRDPGGDAEALERRIEAHLHRALGYPVATFLRTAAEVAAVAALRPFGDDAEEAEGRALYVAFLHAAPSADAERRLAEFRTPTDDFRVHGREVYWRVLGRSSDSAFSGAALERTLGVPATMRSATTVRRLAARYPHPG